MREEEEEEGGGQCSWADPEEEKGQGDPLSHPREGALCGTTTGAESATRSCPSGRGAEVKHGQAAGGPSAWHRPPTTVAQQSQTASSSMVPQVPDMGGF